MIKIGIKNCLLYMSSLLVPIGVQAHSTEEKFQVKFENEQSRDAIISRYSDYDFTRIVPKAGNEIIENRHKESGLHLWYIASAKKTRSAVCSEKELQSEAGIRSISPITYTVMEKPDYELSSERSEKVISYTRSSATTFSDPLYNKQWHYSNSSYVNIDLERAWTLETGKPNVIVAVMDGFIDYNHPDLIPNLWVNEAELNGLPGVDDDGNGYVDDIHGLNLLPEQPFSDHATHIAGTIAAVNNNGIGVCGIAGGDGSGNGVKVMSIGFLTSTVVPDWQLFQAYIYSADNGAVISSNSWRGRPLTSDLQVEGINYFIKNAGHYEGSPMTGGLVVFAAGNDNTKVEPSPINSPDIDRNGLMIVAALSSSGLRAEFSNYGSWVDIAAPGGSNGMGVYSTYTNNRYGFMNGTSMACPHVSGVAALVLSKFGGKEMTPGVLRKRLIDSSIPVDPLQAGYGYEGLMGKGVLNAWHALQDNPERNPEVPAGGKAYHWEYRKEDRMLVNFTVPADGTGQAVAFCEVYAGEKDIPLYRFKTSGCNPGETFSSSIPDAIVENITQIRLRALDQWGNCSEFSEPISVSTDVPPIFLGNFYCTTDFTVYRPSKPGTLETHPQSYLLFPLFLTEHERCQVTEPNGILTEVYQSPNILEFKFEPASDTPLGTYPLEIIIYNAENPSVRATYNFTYRIEREIIQNPQPGIKKDAKCDFYFSENKPQSVIDLNEYPEDPLGLECFIPDCEDEVELGMTSYATYSIRDGILTIDFFIDSDESDFLELNSVNVGVKIHNSYYKESFFNLHFHYDPNGNTGVEEVSQDTESDKFEVYTLMGVRLFEEPQNLPKGIYIINGKKRIIR